jgi:methyl-accepting chemotaxis protein
MRASRSSRVRLKIVALLTSMTALWAFAAYVTVREGLNLLVVNTVGSFGVTTSELVSALQDERRLSMVVLAGAGAQGDLVASRANTDELLAGWHDEAASGSLRFAASNELEDRIRQTEAALAQLGEVRANVDAGDISRREAATRFTFMIDNGFDMFASMASLDDQEIARQSRALVGLAQGRELLSQEDALLAGVLAAGQIGAQDIAEFTQLVGAQRFQFQAASADLAPEDLALFEQAASSTAVEGVRELEDLFIHRAVPNGSPPFSAELWQDTVTPALAEVQGVELEATDNLLQRAQPVGIGVILRLLLAGGLGLVAVIAAIIVSIATARALVRQLERLRDAARDLAHNRLPRVVERLSGGETVDVSTEAPPLRFGDDEIGQVGKAFNAVQETAVRAAVQQAELRHGVRDVFLSLARRTQSLVHKQLEVVDGLEKRETNPDQMEEFYRIDHLATRMRRNAENLIVLAGGTAGRSWRRPVSMVDVIRGGIGEVEDYQRVNLMPVQDGALEGRVVGDVIHLLAELIENAASFSPPYAKVSVSGLRVAHGFVVEIEDRGLGMTEADLAAVNRKLANPPGFSLADASRLGHYVVAKLAQRHDIRVHLRTSPYGGVTAIVLIPQSIMADGDSDRDQLEPGRVPVPLSAAPASASPVAALPPPNPRTEPAAPPPLIADTIVSGTPVNAGPAPAPAPPAGPPVSAPGSPSVDHVNHEGNNHDLSHIVRTPSGLPWRVRQASLPKQLLNEDDDVDELEPRDPEQIRRAMRSFQLGTQRGRSLGEETATEDDQGSGNHHQEG